MTWQEQIEHFRWLASTEEPDLADYIAQRRAQHEAKRWQAIDDLATHGSHGFFGNGPAYAKQTIGEMASFLPSGVRAYAAEVGAGDDPLPEWALGIFDTVCFYELIGAAVDPALLGVLAPLLGRIETSRKVDRAKHWHRGFVALALAQAPVWRGIAGTGPGKPAFRPGEAFGPNVQGLLAYLGSAIDARAQLADVQPAWKTLLATFETLLGASEIDYETLFWIARIVYCDLGGESLARAGDRLWADLQDA